MRRRSDAKEAARAHGVQRTFVSFLETLAEVRRGKRVAIIGVPSRTATRCAPWPTATWFGKLCLLLSQEEREGLEEPPPPILRFNLVLETLAQLKDYDVLVLLASERRDGRRREDPRPWSRRDQSRAVSRCATDVAR